MRSSITYFLISSIASTLLFSTSALAYEAPISDLSSGQSTEQAISLSPQEEMARIKRQLSHLLEINASGKIEALQQEIQTLRGTIEKQSHDIKTLQEQLKNFYQDLDTRVGQIKKTASTQAAKSEPTPSPVAVAKKVETAPLSDYEKAIEAIRNKKYSEAQNLLIQYLSLHPKDQLAGNAHFWLGEVYYQQNKKQLAKREFEIIKKQYPTNAKVPNALLKIGYIEVDEENFGKAKEIFKDVIKTFPGTPSAHLAKIKLEKLTKGL